VQGILARHTAEHAEPADQAEERSPRRVLNASEQAVVVALPLVVVVDVVKREVSVLVWYQVVVVISVEDARVAAVDAVLVIGMRIVLVAVVVMVVVVVIGALVKVAMVLQHAPMETACRRLLEGVVGDLTWLIDGNELYIVRLVAGCLRIGIGPV
jgi:hypothetical protein